MSGRVAEIFVVAGEAVEQGGPLMTFKAIQMGHEIRASRTARVAELLLSAGQKVDPRQALRRLEDAGRARAPYTSVLPATGVHREPPRAVGVA